MWQIFGVVFSISLSIFGTSLAFASGDLAQGAALFKKKCGSCHALSEEARALSGPHLAAIVDAKAGQVEGFKYSKALQQAAAAGLTLVAGAAGSVSYASKRLFEAHKDELHRLEGRR